MTKMRFSVGIVLLNSLSPPLARRTEFQQRSLRKRTILVIGFVWPSTGRPSRWHRSRSLRAIGGVACNLLFTISIRFSSRFSPRISSPIPWMRRFGRLEYCCIESTSSSRVSTLFSSCIFCSFYWIIVL